VSDDDIAMVTRLFVEERISAEASAAARLGAVVELLVWGEPDDGPALLKARVDGEGEEWVDVTLLGHDDGFAVAAVLRLGTMQGWRVFDLRFPGGGDTAAMEPYADAIDRMRMRRELRCCRRWR